MSSKVVFISHSKGKSTDFAKFLYNWLNDSPLGLKSWASFNPEDLGQGEGDQEIIRDHAKRADFCICVLEPKNISNHWINFEAGLFCGRANNTESRKLVFTMLIGGLQHNDLTKKHTHPLGRIYHCLPKDKESLLTLLVTIYKQHAENEPLESVPSSKLDSIKRFIDGNVTDDLILHLP